MDCSTTFTRKFVCIVVACMLFVIGAVVALINNPSTQALEVLLFAGLAFFAGAFV